MREIEVKARISNLPALVEALAGQGIVLSRPVTQHDRVYGVSGVDGGSSTSTPWLRIRTETNATGVTHYFTLKKSVTNQLDSIEHEVVVSDDSELLKIIEQLDFVPYSDLTKTRRRGHAGRIEICVDHVNGLGDFIEGEILTDDDADYSQVVDELWSILSPLGVTQSDQVTDGYDVMMNKQLGRE